MPTFNALETGEAVREKLNNIIRPVDGIGTTADALSGTDKMIVAQGAENPRNVDLQTLSEYVYSAISDELILASLSPAFDTLDREQIIARADVDLVAGVALIRAGLEDRTVARRANSAVEGVRDRAVHFGTQPISTITGLQSALDAKQNSLGYTPENASNKGAANGYAALGPDGRVPASQLPTTGSYLGLWNASTNSPTITSGAGVAGQFYLVSVAGSTTIDGINTWAPGDQIRFSGTVWQRIPNTSAVSSVAGKTGAVTLNTADISGLAAALATKLDTSAYTPFTAEEVNALVGPLFDQPAVDSTNNPPGSPATGSRYLVGPAPTGAWSGQPGRLAVWSGTSWLFSSAPFLGQDVRVPGIGLLSWDNSQWRRRDVVADIRDWATGGFDLTGSNDETAVWNRAVTQLIAEGGGRLNLPNGIISLTNPAAVGTDGGRDGYVQICGVAMPNPRPLLSPIDTSGTILQNTQASGDFIRIFGEGVTLTDLGLRMAPGVTPTGGHMFTAARAEHLKLRGLRIDGGWNGMLIDNCTRILTEDLYIKQQRGAYCLRMQGGHALGYMGRVFCVPGDVADPTQPSTVTDGVQIRGDVDSIWWEDLRINLCRNGLVLGDADDTGKVQFHRFEKVGIENATGDGILLNAAAGNWIDKAYVCIGRGHGIRSRPLMDTLGGMNYVTDAHLIGNDKHNVLIEGDSGLFLINCRAGGQAVPQDTWANIRYECPTIRGGIIGGTIGRNVTMRPGTTSRRTFGLDISGDVTENNGVFSSVDLRGNNAPFRDLSAGGPNKYYNNLIGVQRSRRAIANRLSNADFRKAYRGTDFTLSGAGQETLTSWYARRTGTSSVGMSVSQVSGPFGHYAARVRRVGGNTSTESMWLIQALLTSDSVDLAGRQVMLSAWVRRGGDFDQSAARLRVSTGTGVDQAASLIPGGGWAGHTQQTASLTVSTDWTQVFCPALIPTNATQIAVSLFWTPTGTAGANEWIDISLVEFVDQLDRVSETVIDPKSDMFAGALSVANDGRVVAAAPLTLPSYLVSTVPAASEAAGQLIMVTNASGGAVVAFSDGASWRRVTDRAIIS